MKIVSLILLAVGALVSFAGPKIAKKILKTEKLDDGKVVAIKTAGLLIVLLAAIVVFLF